MAATTEVVTHTAPPSILPAPTFKEEPVMVPPAVEVKVAAPPETAPDPAVIEVKVAAPPPTVPDPALNDVPVIAVALRVDEKLPVVALRAPPVTVPAPTFKEDPVMVPPEVEVKVAALPVTVPVAVTLPLTHRAKLGVDSKTKSVVLRTN